MSKEWRNRQPAYVHVFQTYPNGEGGRETRRRTHGAAGAPKEVTGTALRRLQETTQQAVTTSSAQQRKNALSHNVMK